MHKHKIEAVVFDLEGPLVDIEAVHHKGHIMAAEEFGSKLDLEECLEKIPHFIGGPDEAIAEDIVSLIKQEGRKVKARDILEADLRFFWQILEESQINLRPGFLNVYKTLLSAGYKMAVGSATNSRLADILLEKSGLNALFERRHIVLAKDVKDSADKQEIWFETAKRMGVAPCEQLIVEDASRGIKGAKAVGAVSIGLPVYKNREIISELQRAGADWVFYGWDEFNILDLISSYEFGISFLVKL